MEKHTVLLATELHVEAPTPREGVERAQEWLRNVLNCVPPPEGVTIAKSAGSFSDIAWLAFQLLALEERGGKAAARVAQLRVEVEAELKAEGRQGDGEAETGFEFPYKL